MGHRSFAFWSPGDDGTSGPLPAAWTGRNSAQVAWDQRDQAVPLRAQAVSGQLKPLSWNPVLIGSKAQAAERNETDLESNLNLATYLLCDLRKIPYLSLSFLTRAYH